MRVGRAQTSGSGVHYVHAAVHPAVPQRWSVDCAVPRPASATSRLRPEVTRHLTAARSEPDRRLPATAPRAFYDPRREEILRRLVIPADRFRRHLAVRFPCSPSSIAV
jgi:hypothetical protein